MYWIPENGGAVAAHVLREAEIYERLMEAPHPGIATYYGCLVENGRITGLCLKEYASSLEDALAADTIPTDEKRAWGKAIDAALRHLHGLGLAHNDVNPTNIMMDGHKPVVLDFDSCRPVGEALGKAGMVDWAPEGAETSETKNDFYGLGKLWGEILQVRPEE